MFIDDSDQLEWLHSEEKLALRSACLLRLLMVCGGELSEANTPLHENRTLYSAVHDYISHGNTDPEGVVRFYLENKDAYSL